MVISPRRGVQATRSLRALSPVAEASNAAVVAEASGSSLPQASAVHPAQRTKASWTVDPGDAGERPRWSGGARLGLALRLEQLIGEGAAEQVLVE